MRKYILIPLIFAFIILSFNFNTASASNCAPGELFNTTTGERCSNTSTTVGCQPGFLFSPITGERCEGTITLPPVFPGCPVFTIGTRSEEVRLLQIKLNQDGAGLKADGSYGPLTDAAARRFCPIPPSSGNNPVISGVSGPQSLNVNQQGTWTVKASSSTGGNLSYSVVWGDETGSPAASTSVSQSTSQQTATFTHSYSQAGNYTPIFTVTSQNTIACFTFPCPSNEGRAQTSLSVNVGGVTTSNKPPLIGPILVPAEIAVGQSINFNFSATDADNDDLSWSVNWGESGPAMAGVCSGGPFPGTGTGWNFSVPHAWMNSGNYIVTVYANDCRGGSARTSFMVNVGGTTTAPTIYSILPQGCTSIYTYSSITGEPCTNDRTSVNLGETVYLYGSNISSGDSVGTYSYKDGEVINLPTTFVSSTYLKFVVPSNMETGSHSIQIKNGSNTKILNFIAPNPPTTNQSPAIYSLSPTSGSVGTQVTIYGSSFSAGENLLVQFGSGRFYVTTSSDTSIVFNVPSSLNNCSSNGACTNSFVPVNPGSYSISVSNSNGTSNSLSFTVTGGSGTVTD